jgi:hypothetical protein
VHSVSGLAGNNDRSPDHIPFVCYQPGPLDGRKGGRIYETQTYA